MKYLDYEIDRCRPGDREGVVDLLGQLLGNDREINSRYFAWKYEQNPHADEMPGIVARQEGRVVGFRGYGSSIWQTSPDHTIRVLHPGDTCVDMDHRRKGLSLVMGNLATTDFARSSELFLNLSCTRNSLPGYLRLGFEPLQNKVYLSRYGVVGLAKYLLMAKRQIPFSIASIRLGQFGDIHVTDIPEPEVMASIAQSQQSGNPKFRLSQDPEYFRWRFSGPKERYVFYYLTVGSDPVAYLAMSVAPSGGRGYIVDYAHTGGRSFARLVEFHLTRGDFNVLSVFQHGVSDSVAEDLDRVGFHAGGIMGRLEKRVRGNLPLLVRPIVPDPGERDWIIGGLDIRDANNWFIKGISSDST